jgi:hypothetical protein
LVKIKVKRGAGCRVHGAGCAEEKTKDKSHKLRSGTTNRNEVELAEGKSRKAGIKVVRGARCRDKKL